MRALKGEHWDNLAGAWMKNLARLAAFPAEKGPYFAVVGVVALPVPVLLGPGTSRLALLHSVHFSYQNHIIGLL